MFFKIKDCIYQSSSDMRQGNVVVFTFISFLPIEIRNSNKTNPSTTDNQSGNTQGTDKSRFFLVKNLSDDDCLVAFDSNTDEDKCFLISAGIGEEVSKSFRKVESQDFYTDKIYVKGW